MRIDTDTDAYPEPVTPEDVARAVAGLTKEGKAFIVLIDGHDDAETYVQAAGSVPEEFLVEYRDGRAGEHYRGDRRVSAEELTALLVSYLLRQPDWKAAITWHRLRVDLFENAPSA